MAGHPLDVEQILMEFSGVARLFPLPSLVFFPDSFGPLRVFEPRYVSMVKDALADDGLIALALLKPGWQDDYDGSPAIHRVVCLSRILKHQEAPNGEFEIWLYGLARAQIEEEVPSGPFRRAQVRLLTDLARPDNAVPIARRLKRALALTPGQQPVLGQMRRIANQIRGVDASPGRYADALAGAANFDPETRYELLAETDVLRRYERLIAHLERIAAESAPSAPQPSDPSLN